MRTPRRVALALVVTAVIAAVARLRSGKEPPRRQGGWRELSGPDLS